MRATHDWRDTPLTAGEPVLLHRLAVLAGQFPLDVDEGRVAALRIFEDRAGMEAGNHATDKWQREYSATFGTGIQPLRAGAVMMNVLVKQSSDRRRTFL